MPGPDDESLGDEAGDGDVAERIVLDAAVPGALLHLFIADDRPEYLELAPIAEVAVFTEFPPADRIEF